VMSISAGVATTGTPLITVSGYLTSVTGQPPLRKGAISGEPGDLESRLGQAARSGTPDRLARQP
jgi:hypothetical protein